MPIIERGLVRAINSGKCFAIIGTGPSCEIGIPDWQGIARFTLEKVKDKIDVSKADRLIRAQEYPRFFGHIAGAIGMGELLKLIQDQMTGDRPFGQIYGQIVRWPFQSYLTTNYDDQLQRHLRRQGESFVTRKNNISDMRVLRWDTSGVIFKIHGDFETPGDIVLTGEQYNEFRTGEKRQYWRDILLSCLKMSDVVLIGYSASDPDFKDQLKRLKEIAAPDHPIYMFATGLTREQIDEFFSLNIQVIPYKNISGTHAELKKMLTRYGVFITNRRSPEIGLQPVDAEMAKTASALYLFTNLRLGKDKNPIINRTHAIVLLNVLAEFGQGNRISNETLISKAKEKTFATIGVDPTAVQNAMEYLYKLGFINLTEGNALISLSAKGAAAIEGSKADGKLAEDKFVEFCSAFIEKEYGHLQKQAAEIIENLKLGIIKAFETRGIQIAKFIFTEDPVSISDATDILDIVNKYSEKLGQLDEKAAFADLMIECLLTPNTGAKDYLAALCNGYFAYHALGLDPTCSAERLEIARENCWILDSSIILPLLADDCLNFDWANDLLERMHTLGLKFVTTKRLFFEVVQHARWAVTNFIEDPKASDNLLKAVNAKAGYKQNLFLDGYVKWSATQGAPNLDRYLRHCLGDKYRTDLENTIKEKMEKIDIQIMDFSEWPFYKEEILASRDEAAAEIARFRKTGETYTGDEQCKAEAEAIIICEEEKAIFISQSSFLNRLSTKQKRIAWKPEVTYQFLTFFSTVPAEIDILCQSMNQDFFGMGFDIIDRDAIRNFSSVEIRQARMDRQKEREDYIKVLGEPRVKELEEKFEETPDEYKPFYSMQFAAYVINSQKKQLESLQQRTVIAEKVQELTTTERKELARLKAKYEERKRKRKKEKRRTESKPKKHKRRD
ncbi:MAG: SIR2 family NAD-dependent protein deacylase [Dehalococcoidia bacterium]